jgi:hypothetical protein
MKIVMLPTAITGVRLFNASRTFPMFLLVLAVHRACGTRGRSGRAPGPAQRLMEIPIGL